MANSAARIAGCTATGAPLSSVEALRFRSGLRLTRKLYTPINSAMAASAMTSRFKLTLMVPPSQSCFSRLGLS